MKRRVLFILCPGAVCCSMGIGPFWPAVSKVPKKLTAMSIFALTVFSSHFLMTMTELPAVDVPAMTYGSKLAASWSVAALFTISSNLSCRAYIWGDLWVTAGCISFCCCSCTLSCVYNHSQRKEGFGFACSSSIDCKLFWLKAWLQQCLHLLPWGWKYVKMEDR